MNRKVVSIVVAFLFVLTSAFPKSSKVVMSWKNPNYAGKKFHRVLAMGMSNKTGIRADFEDAMAAQLTQTGVQAIPANTILLRPESTTIDMNYLRMQVRDNHVDAVVVSRLIKVDTTVTYISGFAPFPDYNTFYGYYTVVYPVVYSPDYLRTEKKVRIETNFYATSSPDGDLVWTGVTDTFDPSNVHKAINGLVKLVVKQMQTDGVL